MKNKTKDEKHLLFHNNVKVLNATEGVLVQKQTWINGIEMKSPETYNQSIFDKGSKGYWKSWTATYPLTIQKNKLKMP